MAGHLPSYEPKNPWYYRFETSPGDFTPGLYRRDFPLLPRILMKRVNLAGRDCLDIGCMEGLMSILMVRGGANRVHAIDFADHCLAKINFVQHLYKCDFQFSPVGLMYNLHTKFPGESFDFVNCSGLLYHVFSPLAVMAGVRPLLRKNAFLLVSTNVVLQPGYFMEFNNGGRLQTESNTFWYPTYSLFFYLLNLLQLRPVDAIFLPYQIRDEHTRFTFDKPSAYMSLLCRATEGQHQDAWSQNVAHQSWEFGGATDWLRSSSQPASDIKGIRCALKSPIAAMDACKPSKKVAEEAALEDSHTLTLDALH